MKPRSVILGVCLAALMASKAQALIPKPLSVEELNRHADLVVRATVLEKTVRRDDQGRIYTEVVLQIAEAWRGKPGGERLTVVHSGGVLGNRAEMAIGQVDYRLGEDVVAFLVRNPRGEPVTVGMNQGKFHLEPADKQGVVWASNPFHFGVPTDKARAKSTAPGLTVEELKRRVQGGAK